MGAYINPPNCTKETWLMLNATRIPKPPQWGDIEPGYSVVSLVDNGPFTAAAIAYSESELEVFQNPRDDRPKLWFLCETKLLHEVSPQLQEYLDREEIRKEKQ